MPTVSKPIADAVIAGNGFYPGDEHLPPVTKIVQYRDNWGGTDNLGLIRADEPQDRYETAPDCHDPKVIWVKQPASRLSAAAASTTAAIVVRIRTRSDGGCCRLTIRYHLGSASRALGRPSLAVEAAGRAPGARFRTESVGHRRYQADAAVL
jgi:hypothetical protein